MELGNKRQSWGRMFGGSVAVACMLVTQAGLAQSGQRPPKPSGGSVAPAAAAPTANDPSAKKPPVLGELVKRERERDMILVVSIEVHSDNSSQKKRVRDGQRSVDMPVITPFSYSTMGVVFPLIGETASSVPEVAQKTVAGETPRGFRGVLTIDDAVADSELMVLGGYPAGTNLGRWDAVAPGGTVEARQMKLEVTIPTTLYRTVFDESAALRLDWPKAWPEIAQSTFAPQLFVDKGIDETGKIVDYDVAPVEKALEMWTKEWGVSDLKQIKPAMLAKLLASKVWELVQPTGDGLTLRARTGELSGIMLRAPAETLVTGRGSEHDLTALLAVLYRKAGLPTRIVSGYDVGVDDGSFLGKGSKNNQLKSWLEFYLFDEAKNTFNWVPVDIVKLRKTSSRPQKVERTWKYFGTNDELDRVVPFAFQFHPPTDVVCYGSPGFWGWFVTPKAPDTAEQALRFSASAASKRADDKKDRKNNR